MMPRMMAPIMRRTVVPEAAVALLTQPAAPGAEDEFREGTRSPRRRATAGPPTPAERPRRARRGRQPALGDDPLPALRGAEAAPDQGRPRRAARRRPPRPRGAAGHRPADA